MSRYTTEYDEKNLTVRYAESDQAVHVSVGDVMQAVAKAVTDCLAVDANAKQRINTPGMFAYGDPVGQIKTLAERDASIAQVASSAGERIAAIIQLAVREVI